MQVTSSSVDGETEEVVVQLAECASFCLNVNLTTVFLRASRQAAVKTLSLTLVVSLKGTFCCCLLRIDKTKFPASGLSVVDFASGRYLYK